MTNTFIASMIGIAVFSGILMSVLQWMVKSDKYKQYRIRTPEVERIPMSVKARNIAMNMVFSIGIFTFYLYFFHGYLFTDSLSSSPLSSNNAASYTTMFGEVLAVLLIYDCLYYFLHRIFHYPKVMKAVHGVHHKARFPTAVESVYLHPLENLAGLSLLMLTTMLIGPVSMTAFLLIVFIHTTANILTHSNLVLPNRIFVLPNFWATKHDAHHGKHLNKNFSSLFPFWDQMFGTAI